MGLGIPVFAALNGNLGARLQNTVLAAIIASSIDIFACLGGDAYIGKNS